MASSTGLNTRSEIVIVLTNLSTVLREHVHLQVHRDPQGVPAEVGALERTRGSGGDHEPALVERGHHPATRRPPRSSPSRPRSAAVLLLPARPARGGRSRPPPHPGPRGRCRRRAPAGCRRGGRSATSSSSKTLTRLSPSATPATTTATALVHHVGAEVVLTDARRGQATPLTCTRVAGRDLRRRRRAPTAGHRSSFVRSTAATSPRSMTSPVNTSPHFS